MYIHKDNFFDNFEIIKEQFKKIKLYNLKDYKKLFDQESNWPGFRSDDLYKIEPFLFNLIIKEIFDKFNNQINRPFKIKSYVHLRLDKDNSKDFIHTDDTHFDLTMLVFLSENNLSSGTGLYKTTKSKNPFKSYKFKQNRAVLFDSSIPHKSLNNFGQSIENGRLTLNSFLKFY
mgnify:CR=1 FL=1|tara:strand:- start:995 stop:1516 length:522 start_codon:yes stop_codon:yes gene_type:complete